MPPVRLIVPAVTIQTRSGCEDYSGCKSRERQKKVQVAARHGVPAQITRQTHVAVSTWNNEHLSKSCVNMA